MVFFVVLMVVFIVHTDSNLWVVYPDRMVLKDKASTLEHVCWSAMLSGVYSLFGVALSALLARPLRRSGNAEPDASPNSRPPSQFPSSSEIQTPDSLRTPSSGGCG